jgi:hypothetical protein
VTNASQPASDSFRGTFACPICTLDEQHPHNMLNRWIGVDFDNTLATEAPNRSSPYELGEPIPAMVARVKEWLAKGYRVKVFTARMCEWSYTTGKPRDIAAMEAILQDWCVQHIGQKLECTCTKDGSMEVLWDDRAVRVRHPAPKAAS